MRLQNIDKIFNPFSTAVIGASEKEGSVGSAIIKNILKGGYKGRLLPVNPKLRKVYNLDAYPSIESIDEQVDLAVIATPIITVPKIIRECVHAGVGGAVILSAGGKETGEKGREIEASIAREIRGTELRIIGPNCAGIIATRSKLNATFADGFALPGDIAFISQSGAICYGILDVAQKERIGFSHFISIGSMLDIDFGDLIDYLGSDPKVRSIVLYIEGLSNCRRFMTAARAVSRVKPIIALKSGRSPAGARAAVSHTGSLAGADAVYDVAFKRAGIVRVNSIEEFFDCAELLSKQPLPKGPNLAIITNAGGPGVMAADALSAYGIEPAGLGPQTLEKLDSILPPYWSRNNPVDILGDASAETFRSVVEVCNGAAEVDASLVIYVPQALSNPVDIAKSLIEINASKSYTILTVWIGGQFVEKASEMLNEAGIPTYETPERAVRAFIDLLSYGRNLAALQEIPPRLSHDLEFDSETARKTVDDALDSGNQILTEIESKRLLAAYGIPVSRTESARSVDEALFLAKGIGFPLVMKIDSPDISHKSDAGAVRLDIRNEEEAGSAFHEIMANSRAYNPRARLAGVSIQPMLQQPNYELILGCKKDPDFGPVLLFGTGGIMTEVLKDRSLALPPLNRLLAGRMIQDTRVYQLLKGFRGRQAVNLELLEEILIRLSQLVMDFPEIVELDINPLIAYGNQVLAVDGRAVVQRAKVVSPQHLVISPYPRQYEKTSQTDDGIPILLRPIKPEDAPLVLDLFSGLSPRTIRSKFLWPMKSLSRQFLVRLTQIDYDRDMALVAIQKQNKIETMLGLARFICNPEGTKAEFSVVVRDDMQKKGIGRKLLDACLSAAADRNIECIWGLVSGDNTLMLNLGREIGFMETKIRETDQFELRINPCATAGSMSIKDASTLEQARKGRREDVTT